MFLSQNMPSSRPEGRRVGLAGTYHLEIKLRLLLIVYFDSREACFYQRHLSLRFMSTKGLHVLKSQID